MQTDLLLQELGLRRALITGCVRDSGRHLPALFRNIELLRTLFEQSDVLLLENDSRDDTVAAIRAYAAEAKAVHALGFPGLAEQIPIKTVRLAHLRNTALAWQQQRGGWSDLDVLVVLDCDSVNADPWDLQAYSDVLGWWWQQPDGGGLFANQEGPYYDLWALRHPQQSPDDVWAAIAQLHGQRPDLTDPQLLEAVYAPRQFTLDPAAAPLAVQSAFGGLGFYRASWLQRVQPRYCGEQPLAWDGPEGRRWWRWQCCEHVSFNQALSHSGAKLWIHPRLINWNTRRLQQQGGLRPNPSGWRHLPVC